MAINEEQVKHVAKLAKLSFSDDELNRFYGSIRQNNRHGRTTWGS